MTADSRRLTANGLQLAASDFGTRRAGDRLTANGWRPGAESFPDCSRFLCDYLAVTPNIDGRTVSARGLASGLRRTSQGAAHSNGTSRGLLLSFLCLHDWANGPTAHGSQLAASD